MNYPQLKVSVRNLGFQSFLTALCLTAFAFNMVGQKMAISHDKKVAESVDIGRFTPETTETCPSEVLTMTGSTATDGADGNIRTFNTSNLSVKASAFSRRNSDGLWQTAFLGAYGGGLGVTDQGEGDGSSNRHTVDNIGDRKNYVLFEFNKTVVVNRAFLDSIGADSDITVWVGNAANPYNNHLTLSDATLSGFGSSEDNNAANGDPRWADINAGQEAGNVLVIAASTSDSTPDDEFKIKQLDLKCQVTPPCIAGEITMTGNSATDGTDGNIRAFSSGSLSVKASAFSRRNSDGLWQTAFLGAYGGGLGVTDRGEEDGSANRHTVDNIGDRKNYVLFEFNRPVVVDRAFLDSIGADSDITVWVGNTLDPYNNHLTLSDATLSGFGPSEDNNAANGDPRWADINAGQEGGNVLVIAASTSDSTPDDEFKIKILDAKCSVPPATVTIIKEVQTFGGGTSSTQSFPFTATKFGTANFSLVDQNTTGPDRVINNSILNFGAGNAITVKESQLLGWTLLDITCTETGLQNTTTNLGTRTATIIAEQGESIVCRFRNGQLTPSAADASVVGRIKTQNGRGISGATVTLTNLSTGAVRIVRSNTFGYYAFDGIEVSELYSLSVRSSRYVFAPDTQYFTLNDNLSGADFVSEY